MALLALLLSYPPPLPAALLLSPVRSALLLVRLRAASQPPRCSPPQLLAARGAPRPVVGPSGPAAPAALATPLLVVVLLLLAVLTAMDARWRGGHPLLSLPMWWRG
eukprot:SAG25_NODE_215_length_11684_cov_261.443677_8_plen_106_part_00